MKGGSPNRVDSAAEPDTRLDGCRAQSNRKYGFGVLPHITRAHRAPEFPPSLSSVPWRQHCPRPAAVAAVRLPRPPLLPGPASASFQRPARYKNRIIHDYREGGVNCRSAHRTALHKTSTMRERIIRTATSSKHAENAEGT